MRRLNLPADPDKPDDARRIDSSRARIGVPTATVTSGSLVVQVFTGFTRGHAISRAEKFARRHKYTPHPEFHDIATAYWTRWWRRL